jgi:thiamine-monophosphate kinase
MSATEKNDVFPEGMGRYDLLGHIALKTGLQRTETAFGTATVEGKDRLLVSQSMMLEGIDFNLVYFPLKHLGYKAVIRSVAGIYASGGTPSSISISVAMSARFGVEQAGQLFEGALLAAKKYAAEIRLFDLTSSVTGMTINCTSWGYKHESAGNTTVPVANDLICVTGDLGAAYLGLQVLERERRIFESGAAVQPDLSDYEYTIGRQLRPDLKIETLNGMRAEGIAPSVMTIIREGLASELLGLCKTADKGCRIYYDKIPVDNDTSRNAGELNIDPVVAARNGGEDYEFLFFAPIEMVEAISKTDGIRMIGYLTEPSEGCNLVTPGDELVKLRARGWNDLQEAGDL